MINHCGFNLHFLDSYVEHVFMYALGHLYVFFWKSVYLGPLPIFKLGYLHFCYGVIWVPSSLHILDIDSLSDIKFANISYRGSVPRTDMSSEVSANMDWVWCGKPGRACRSDSNLCPIVCMAHQTFMHQTFAFPSPYELPFSPVKPQTTIPNILFCLQVKMVFKVRTLAILVNHSVFHGLFHVWRRKWQPTPVLLPEKFHGQRSLVGYSP